jgi:chromosome partition protein MukE
MNEITTMTDVFNDKRFPVVDVALRKGIHFTEDDIDSYKFLVEAREHLSAFYLKYSAEVIYDPEGYIFLSPKEGVFRQGKLKPGEMILGQVLALFTTDPKSLRDGGKIKVEDILLRLSHLLPTDQLAGLFYAQRKRKSRTDLDEKKFRETVEKYLRTLCSLGFAVQTKDGCIRPLKSVFRFTPFARTTVARENVEAELIDNGFISKVNLTASESEETNELDEQENAEEENSEIKIETKDPISDEEGFDTNLESEITEAIDPEALH